MFDICTDLIVHCTLYIVRVLCTIPYGVSSTENTQYLSKNNFFRKMFEKKVSNFYLYSKHIKFKENYNRFRENSDKLKNIFCKIAFRLSDFVQICDSDNAFNVY